MDLNNNEETRQRENRFIRWFLLAFPERKLVMYTDPIRNFEEYRRFCITVATNPNNIYYVRIVENNEFLFQEISPHKNFIEDKKNNRIVPRSLRVFYTVVGEMARCIYLPLETTSDFAFKKSIEDLIGRKFQSECIVCLTEHVQITNCPVCFCIMCSQCFQNILTTTQKCPMCRKGMAFERKKLK